MKVLIPNLGGMDVDDILWTTLLHLEERGLLADLCQKGVKQQLKDINLSPEGNFFRCVLGCV